MASAIPAANIRGTAEKLRSRRLDALLDLSRGEHPLILTRQRSQKESERNATRPTEASQSRAQEILLRQCSLTQQSPIKAEIKSSRPPLTQTQSGSTSLRSGISTGKPIAATGNSELSKQPRTFLHHKQSSLLRDPSSTQRRNLSRPEPGRTGSSSSITKSPIKHEQNSSFSDRSVSESPEGTRSAQQPALHPLITQATRLYSELDRYRDIQVPSFRDPFGSDSLYKLSTEDLPPPTPQFSASSSHGQLSSFSGSPSTRFSGSPGPGPYSRDTTPTSVCSQSPGLVAPLRLPATRVRQASPAETRPPVTRRRTGSVSNEGAPCSSDQQGLAAVRETLTSSSSNSTVRAEEKDSKAQRRVPLSPPKLPARKSSQNPNKSRNTDETQPLKLSENHARTVMRSPSPSKVTRSVNNRLLGPAPVPQRRPTPPFRPSRDGTPELYARSGGPASTIHSNSSSMSVTEKSQSGQLLPSSLPRTVPHVTGRERTLLARPSYSREPAPALRSGALVGTQSTKTETGKITTTPSPKALATKPKFSLFRRRTKSGSEESQAEKTDKAEKKDKTSRRGPAAGTGHEGYGRVGAIRRRSSTILQRGFPGPVSPSESLAGTVSTDQFLLERLNPIIIAGGAVVENQNTGIDFTKTENNHGVLRRTHSRKGSAVSPGIQSSFCMMSTRAQSAASTAMTFQADGPFCEVESEQNRTILQIKEPAKSSSKTAKPTRRWNIFGRSQAAAGSKAQTKSVAATVEPTRRKPSAFYTMIETSEQDTVGSKPNIGEIRRDAEIPAIADLQLNHDRRPSASSAISHLFRSKPGKDAAYMASKPGDNITHILSVDTREDQLHAEKNSFEPPRNHVLRHPKSFSRPFNHISIEPMSPQRTQEFLALKSRGHNMYGYAAYTARIPEPSAPLGEDEIWDEFDDLFEDHPPSPSSSCGVPFQLEAYSDFFQD
ncbi:hypothetical protein GGS21DRAFT_519100 [Xylaria nigripes]|nr:hypothetical protein GGS21DRAFT_519100 [Xylaria nigripes]